MRYKRIAGMGEKPDLSVNQSSGQVVFARGIQGGTSGLKRHAPAPETHVPHFSPRFSRGLGAWLSIVLRGGQDQVTGLVADVPHLGEQVP